MSAEILYDLNEVSASATKDLDVEPVLQVKTEL